MADTPMKRLALFCLILSLLAPRFAWAAHMSGHELISFSAAREHRHEGGHHHRDDADVVDHDEQDADKSGGFAHAHPPAIMLAFVAILTSDGEVATFLAPQLIGHLTIPDGEHLQAYSTLLRPPQAA
jgi:hypothetical protein